MQVFIATDIFGITDKLLAYSRQLAASGCKVEFIDPYQGEKQDLANEQVAYQRFSQDCGFEAYVGRVSAALAGNGQKKIILGFSVGAAAAYKALDALAPGGRQEQAVRHLIAFYPGQIRHHLKINPRTPITLIFPRSEQHFELDKVIHCLAEKANICCIQTPFAHGFMNPLSVNFHLAAANHYFGRLSRKNLQLAPKALQGTLLAEQMSQALSSLTM
ncbi:dienelactone hydrolase family protein [Thalassomonas haliotis]|uniref:Dienelactone hydrolase family protein n=1 Tax=Thalassomonas haliotis TaxID=485448 RepID=A0ABY7V9W3_9GAMM|nr:dienelactone hydrolase family protein [Thalassomonas haliotis]WDE10412.1 dienelactone hydrolase family protein [Thalassomonas haliotis]